VFGHCFRYVSVRCTLLGRCYDRFHAIVAVYTFYMFLAFLTENIFNVVFLF